MKFYIFLILGILLFGCVGTDTGTVSDNNAVDDAAENNEPVYQPSEPTDEQTEDIEINEQEQSDLDELEQTQDSGNKKILIMGRSVAYGWTEYMGLEWQCDNEECLTGSPRGEYHSYDVIYYELDYPPEIANAAINGVDQYGDDADIVFFKLCFADFGSDPNVATDNFEYIVDVYEYVVLQKGKTLIVGNALPMVASQTDPELVLVHRNYNKLINDFAVSREGIQVLDLYSITSDSSGALRSDYAVASDDSHLNSAAYTEVTKEFMQLVEE